MSVGKEGLKGLAVLTVLAVTAAVTVPRAAVAQCCSLPKVAVASGSAAGDSILVLDISGMTCDDCAAHVYKALTRVKGVKQATVSYPGKQARVRVAKPTAAEKKLVEAVRKAGYDAHVREKTPAAEEKSSPEAGKSTGL
ncbi:MAG: cation transporter [Candidatus Eisenbacteria bacterium]|nr:cation transporter [Candidatus Eisenbacteria bacterium]